MHFSKNEGASVDLEHLKRLITQVAEQSISVDEAIVRLKNLPYEDLGFARVDNHRTLRQGVPETILCTGKTGEQVAVIARTLLKHHKYVLATRAQEEHLKCVMSAFPESKHYKEARILVISSDANEHSDTNKKPDVIKKTGASENSADTEKSSQTKDGTFKAVVMCAGTADLPVAEECAVVLEHYKVPVKRIYDVGVAGVHRLLDARAELEAASAIVVVAGMDGALPSVVGGLVSQPVIAVPTSIGYGANFEGLAPLLTMLNSCAHGVSVVNIDNGFGAAMAVLRLRIVSKSSA